MNWNIINQFLVKEQVALFKAANNYDIYDLESGQQLLECREENLGIFTKILRFTDYKRMTPFSVQIRDMSGKLVVEVTRGISLINSTVTVTDAETQVIGTFSQKFFSIGGKFAVLDKNQVEISMLQGKWTGWDFKFSSATAEHAHVTKKWAGIGKELFTSADNYVLDISSVVPANSDLKKLILAAVMCIDMVLKE